MERMFIETFEFQKSCAAWRCAKAEMGKNESDNLTAEERKEIKQFVKQLGKEG